MNLLFVHLSECCAQHYAWNSPVCLNTPATLNSNLYYPDWEGDDTCKNGGGQPEFMNNAPELWMHSTLAACCDENYLHKVNECNGGSSTSTSMQAASPRLYYPDWTQNSNHVCVNDGNQPEYMNKNPGEYLFSSQRECCNSFFA